MKEQLYKANFVFNKACSDLTRKIMEKEFMRLRKEAIEILNPMYEKWNREYSGPEPNGDIYSEESKPYNDYISHVSRQYLNENPPKTKAVLTILDIDEIGDVIGRCKFDKSLFLTLELEPVS